jgi:hypothetical protein
MRGAPVRMALKNATERQINRRMASPAEILIYAVV